MPWLATDKDGAEYIYDRKPARDEVYKEWSFIDSPQLENINCIELPQGSIEKLIGRELTWADDPVELSLKAPFVI